MTGRDDPLVTVLVGLVIDALWFLDSCGDDEVDPDSAVKVMEGVVGVLQQLPDGQLDRFLQTVIDLAEAEPNQAKRDFLTSFPSVSGLAHDNQS